jgi:hypothetical protein
VFLEVAVGVVQQLAAQLAHGRVHFDAVVGVVPRPAAAPPIEEA